MRDDNTLVKLDAIKFAEEDGADTLHGLGGGSDGGHDAVRSVALTSESWVYFSARRRDYGG